MTLGSLFDGIDGWLLAARHAGVTPVWSSEIEPFPCAVTARHFPDVKQLGGITQIDPDTLTPVDIICAGISEEAAGCVSVWSMWTGRSFRISCS